MASAGGHWTKVAQGDIGKLVFVPKGQTATQAITGEKPRPVVGIASPDETTKVKGLGGSTGALLVQDSAGNLYVHKKGGNSGHLLEESMTDNAYRALGLDVPEHKVFDGPVKMARFVEGQTLDHAMANDQGAANKAMGELRKGFAADALLANWDVIGLGYDNVLIGKNLTVYRIDNGGALRYRAQGALKAKFDEFPLELFTMRSHGTAGHVFGSLKLADLTGQISALLPKRTQALAAIKNLEVRNIVRSRFMRMQQFVDIAKALGGKSGVSVESFIQALWIGQQSGKITKNPATAAEIQDMYAAWSGGVL